MSIQEKLKQLIQAGNEKKIRLQGNKKKAPSIYCKKYVYIGIYIKKDIPCSIHSTHIHYTFRWLVDKYNEIPTYDEENSI